MRIAAHKVNINPFNSEHELYTCSIKIKDLLDDSQFCIDRWDEDKIGNKDQGYQRIETPAHVRNIKASILCDGVDFPTSILLSLRRKAKSSPNYSYSKDKYVLSVNEFPVYIIDGQHRIAGIREAFKELKNTEKDISNEEIAATLMIGLDKYEEMKYFEVVNSKAKRVRTDLANELMWEQASINNPNQASRTAAKQDMIKLMTVGVVHELKNRDNSPWFNKIKMPNNDSKKSPDAVTNQGQLVASLKPVIEEGYLRTQVLDVKVNVINEYWSALQELFPNAFENPKKHVIQKTNGIFALHLLLNNLIPIITTQRKQDLTKENFLPILTQVFEHMIDDGTFKTKHEGSKFWQSGNLDGASLYRGQAGFKDLYQRMLEGLGEQEW